MKTYLAICSDPSVGLAEQYRIKADRARQAMFRAIRKHWQLNGYTVPEARVEAESAIACSFTKNQSSTGPVWTAADNDNYWVLVLSR